MARYTIDAPTLLHLVDTGAGVPTAHQLVAPSSIRSEALELLLGAVRRGERSEADARAAHVRMTETKIRTLGDRMSRWTAWKVAVEQGWDGLRDAEYVAVTRLQADALATVDPRLAGLAGPLVPLASLASLEDLLA